MPYGLFHKVKRPLPPIQKDTHTAPQAAITFAPRQGCRPWPACRPTYKGRKPIAIHSMPHSGMGFCHCTADGLGHWQGRGMAWAHAAWGLSSCSKLIAIKLCAISEMHAKVRRERVAGYATDETLVCCPKEHTRWWQRYSGHLQGLLYRLILNSYLLIRHNDCILQAFMPAAPCVPQALRPAPRESKNRGHGHGIYAHGQATGPMPQTALAH